MPTSDNSSPFEPVRAPKCFLGIDIGGHSSKMSLHRPGQSPTLLATCAYDDPTAEQLKDHIRQALIASAPEAMTQLHAVGLCLPGLLSSDSSRLMHAANLPRLAGLSLAELVTSIVGRPAPFQVSSDAVACCIDVAVEQQLSGRVFGLVLGTGVGAAVLDDGVPLRVDGDSPGHFGQLDVSLSADAPVGPDGGRGSLEAYLGTPALKRRLGPNLRDVLPSLPASDPILLALARAIRIGHALYRPHHVVLAGGTALSLTPLLPVIDAVVRDGLTNLTRKGWTLTFARDAHHAARGAARLAEPLAG